MPANQRDPNTTFWIIVAVVAGALLLGSFAKPSKADTCRTRTSLHEDAQYDIHNITDLHNYTAEGNYLKENCP
jgi:hypothetical protein